MKYLEFLCRQATCVRYIHMSVCVCPTLFCALQSFHLPHPLSLYCRSMNSSTSSHTQPPLPPTSYRISQEVVSATCGCIVATAARCHRQALDKKATQAAIVKEFSNCLQNIIRGCMQHNGRQRGRAPSTTFMCVK